MIAPTTKLRETRQNSTDFYKSVEFFLHLLEDCAILEAVLPGTVGGSPIFSGVIFFAPDPHREGVSSMITWSELFQFCTLIIALLALVVQIIENSKKK